MDLRFSIPHRVQTNVAIAAAITSYARIHMMHIKALPNIEVYYTDTDSFFLTGNIPENLLSNSELGLFKNELQYKENGILKEHKIVKAYFFDKKFYAYKLDNGKHKTVISGVPKNFLNWDQIELLAKGEQLELDLNTFFFKYLTNLSIAIKSKNMVIKHHNKSKLIGNDYESPNLILDNQQIVDRFVILLINRIRGSLRKLRKDIE